MSLQIRALLFLALFLALPMKALASFGPASVCSVIRTAQTSDLDHEDEMFKACLHLVTGASFQKEAWQICYVIANDDDSMATQARALQCLGLVKNQFFNLKDLAPCESTAHRETSPGYQIAALQCLEGLSNTKQGLVGQCKGDGNCLSQVAKTLTETYHCRLKRIRPLPADTSGKLRFEITSDCDLRDTLADASLCPAGTQARGLAESSLKICQSQNLSVAATNTAPGAAPGAQ